MKTIIIITLFLVGCTPSKKPHNNTSSTLNQVGKWDIESGSLYKYVVDNDTIYIVEGDNMDYPLSISVK